MKALDGRTAFVTGGASGIGLGMARAFLGAGMNVVVADLRTEAGDGPVVTQFSTQNGEAALLRHFDDVRREDLATRAVFPDHASAMAYLRSSLEDIAWDLPAFSGPREYAGEVTVFLAR